MKIKISAHQLRDIHLLDVLKKENQWDKETDFINYEEEFPRKIKKFIKALKLEDEIIIVDGLSDLCYLGCPYRNGEKACHLFEKIDKNPDTMKKFNDIIAKYYNVNINQNYKYKDLIKILNNKKLLSLREFIFKLPKNDLLILEKEILLCLKKGTLLF
jgi:hypothetical protein